MVLSSKKNISDPKSAFLYLRQSKLVPGQRMHVGLVGQHVHHEATFLRLLWSENIRTADKRHGDIFMAHCKGVAVEIDGSEIELPWADLVELRPR